jgi:two-component system sensor histidine kinase ChiS
MAVAFCDLRSFTTLSEKLEPRATFRFLNRYLAAIGPVARAHHGYIDKYIGDGILAIFPDGADDALTAARAMQCTVDGFNAELVATGESPVAIGVGVQVGPLVLGIIGENERLEGTVIADCVNVACRIEALCKEHGAGIVTTRECLDSTADPSRYKTRPLGSLAVRGKAQAVQAYELLDIVH